MGTTNEGELFGNVEEGESLGSGDEERGKSWEMRERRTGDEERTKGFEQGDMFIGCTWEFFSGWINLGVRDRIKRSGGRKEKTDLVEYR